MTALDKRLDRDPVELNGEKYAREYVEVSERIPASAMELRRYLASRNWLIKRKSSQGGVLGVSAKSSSTRLYGVSLPGKVVPQLHFRNPVQAAVFYNLWVKDKFGDDAVLCDIRAVIRQFLAYELRGQFRV